MADYAQWGPTIVLLALILGFLVKMAPTWKDLKLREFDMRVADNATREKEAAALSQLGGGLERMSETMQVIAVEQRKATEAVELSQRINADSADRLDDLVRTVSVQFKQVAERVDRLEKPPNANA